LQTFSAAVPRFQSLRKVGVNSLQMVRSAGPPAILYGCETMGVSDTALHAVRTKVASAAAPQAGGKNPDLTLLALDGSEGTLDPAFDAHGSPLKHWAVAVWDTWFSDDQLATAFAEAARKLEGAKGSWWNVAAGPTIALIASLHRIGWSMPSAFEVVDDLGRSWHFKLDSPAAISTACKDAVRRWRLRRIGKLFPCLIPQQPDAGSHCEAQGDLVISFTSVVSPLVKGKRCKRIAGGMQDLWDPKWAGDLASAICGGQWPQVRKAMVPEWNIVDNRCQLCLAEVGTLEHRLSCSATMPIAGWPAPPPAAGKVLSAIGNERRKLLQTRGMLVLKLPARTQYQHGKFKWLLEPSQDDPRCDTAVWYFDGSMLNGRWKELRATGFGVVVTSTDGDLLGFGQGLPPSWCTTAASAEAWALHIVLTCCPFPPQMRTDCLSLLRVAEEGTRKAVDATKQLARIWVLIAGSLDNDVSTLTNEGLLVWMPAHQSLCVVGEAKLSNGRRLTATDWRANRLVDALAKRAAKEVQAPRQVLALMASADAATAHAAALLGCVTHASNNHKVNVVDADGNSVTRTFRDAEPRPTNKKRKAAVKPDGSHAQPLPQSSCEGILPWTPLSNSQPARKRRLTALQFEARTCAAALGRRVAEIGASLSTPPDAVPAAKRLEQLHRRVKARLAAPAL